MMLKQITQSYRYGSVIPMLPITNESYRRVIAWTGVWLGLVKGIKRSARKNAA